MLTILATLLFSCGSDCPNFLLNVASGADQKDIVHRAQQAYYNLRSEGLISYRCTVQPDWSFAYSKIEADSIGLQLKPFLEGTDFQVSVGPEGAATVSRQSRIPPPTQLIADRLRMVTAGVENTLVGFFGVMAMFVFRSPVPAADSDFHFQESDGVYRISQEQGAAVLLITLNHDLTCKELTSKLPQVEATVRPRFHRSTKGYVLDGYQSRLQATSNTSSQVTIILDGTIEYLEIEGFKLPAVFNVKVVTPASTAQMKYSFGRYEVSRR